MPLELPDTPATAAFLTLLDSVARAHGLVPAPAADAPPVPVSPQTAA